MFVGEVAGAGQKQVGYPPQQLGLLAGRAGRQRAFDLDEKGMLRN